MFNLSNVINLGNLDRGEEEHQNVALLEYFERWFEYHT